MFKFPDVWKKIMIQMLYVRDKEGIRLETSVLSTTVGPRTMLILGTRKISVFRKQCIAGYYIGTSGVSAKFCMQFIL